MALDITTLARAQRRRIARQQEALEVAEQLEELKLQPDPEAWPRPRMRQGANGVWRGVPRGPVDSSCRPTSISVAVYSAEPEPIRSRAQINLRLGQWETALSSAPDQLREFAALLTEAADLLDMLQRLDCGADGGRP